MLLDLVGDAAHDAGVEPGPVLGVKKRRDGHAPRALAADAPVGARLDGAADAGLAPGRHPLHLADASSAAWRVPPLSSDTNHWSTARKTMGVFERQQCG